MEAPDMSEDIPSRYGPYELSPYPSTIVNRGALPEGFLLLAALASTQARLTPARWCCPLPAAS